MKHIALLLMIFALTADAAVTNDNEMAMEDLVPGVVLVTNAPSRAQHATVSGEVVRVEGKLDGHVAAIGPYVTGTVSNLTGPRLSSLEGQTNLWNAAYGWGNHALAGYLTAYVETDPLFAAWRDTNTYVKVELDATALGVIATQKISQIEIAGRIIDATGGVWQVVTVPTTNWFFSHNFDDPAYTRVVTALTYPLPENFSFTFPAKGGTGSFECFTDLPIYDRYTRVTVPEVAPTYGSAGPYSDFIITDGGAYTSELYRAQTEGTVTITNHIGTLALSGASHASLTNLDWTATGHYGTPGRLAGFFEGGIAGYSALGYGLYFDGSDNLTVSNEIVAGAALGVTAVQPSRTLTINGITGNLSSNNVWSGASVSYVDDKYPTLQDVGNFPVVGPTLSKWRDHTVSPSTASPDLIHIGSGTSGVVRSIFFTTSLGTDFVNQTPLSLSNISSAYIRVISDGSITANVSLASVAGAWFGRSVVTTLYHTALFDASIWLPGPGDQEEFAIESRFPIPFTNGVQVTVGWYTNDSFYPMFGTNYPTQPSFYGVVNYQLGALPPNKLGALRFRSFEYTGIIPEGETQEFMSTPSGYGCMAMMWPASSAIEGNWGFDTVSGTNYLDPSFRVSGLEDGHGVKATFGFGFSRPDRWYCFDRYGLLMRDDDNSRFETYTTFQNRDVVWTNGTSGAWPVEESLSPANLFHINGVFYSSDERVPASPVETMYVGTDSVPELISNAVDHAVGDVVDAKADKSTTLTIGGVTGNLSTNNTWVGGSELPDGIITNGMGGLLLTTNSTGESFVNISGSGGVWGSALQVDGNIFMSNWGSSLIRFPGGGYVTEGVFYGAGGEMGFKSWLVDGVKWNIRSLDGDVYIDNGSLTVAGTNTAAVLRSQGAVLIGPTIDGKQAHIFSNGTNTMHVDVNGVTNNILSPPSLSLTNGLTVFGGWSNIYPTVTIRWGTTNFNIVIKAP